MGARKFEDPWIVTMSLGVFFTPLILWYNELWQFLRLYVDSVLTSQTNGLIEDVPGHNLITTRSSQGSLGINHCYIRKVNE